MTSPLTSTALFHLGPVPITGAVAATWAIMAVLVLGAMFVTRRLALDASAAQSAFEMIVETVDGQVRDTMDTEPGPYRAFIGTLFAALALLVFLAVIWFGIRAGGVRGYLATFATPSLVMVPLNVIESITRTFSLLVRLFGNVMSGVFIVGIVLSLAGLLVPIPLMALDLLTGAVQAYIFAILAMVFIAGAIGEAKPVPDPSGERTSA